MKQSLLLSFTLLFCANVTIAQQKTVYKTWNPEKDKESVVGGQGWHSGIQNFYDRLPSKAEGAVRKPVWNLSKNSAGLNIRFKSDAPEIVVKYQVSGPIQMFHMPSTGVSGVDLYAKDGKGKYSWASGNYVFGDTIVCRFRNIGASGINDREYTLYLPLYNTVKWMEISVPEKNTFSPLPVVKKKPIVVYGTSIAQGACASRPGLAWTNMLSRKLDQPIINLAFSGNGRLEKEVYELLPEIDASLYILDCLPNLTSAKDFNNEEIVKRVLATVAHLQAKRPGVPILLTEHDGYTDDGLYPARKSSYERVNVALNTALAKLKEAGVKQIYHLTKAEINQDIESMVDGTHPNDIGMLHYAEAYEKAVKKILK
jgi:lysophospholipase L1-like esterase